MIARDTAFCGQCLPCLRPVASPLCLCCGAPFLTPVGPDHVCGACLTRPPAFRQARSWMCYHTGGESPQPISEAIRQFKYHRNLAVGKTLASLAVTVFPLRAETYDVIVPVPLHISRLRWRGFNQALLLSRAVGRARKVRVDPFLLDRTRPTVPQTQLKARERQENVKGAFVVTTPERLQGKRILLVDDVYTSGATVEECAKTLRRAGARVVDVYTLARAVSH